MAARLPSVSLIVLNWNGKRHLQGCLPSLLALDYPAGLLEVIVVDNGSRDGSVQLLEREFPSVKLVRFERNLGFAEPNNIAAADASGEWIGFLNNDMWVEPGWLRNLLSSLDDHPQAACLGSRIKNWDGSALDFIGGGVNYQGHGFQLDHGSRASDRDVERPVLFGCGGAMLIRKSIYDEVGGFDPDFFAYFEDVDLGWRLNLLGHQVWYTPRATAFHRHHSTGGRLPAHKLRVLYERNALFTIYKNLDAENLAAALPAAMVLLNERALGLAGLDLAAFRLAPAPERTEEPAERPAARRLYAYDPAAPLGESLPRRARRVLKQQGLGTAAGKSIRYLRYRTVAAIRGGLLAVLFRVAPDAFFLPGVAAAHHVALSEFGHALDRLNVKREWLQERRRRSDLEILPLLEDPFFANYTDPRYLRFYRWLSSVQGLDRRFTRPAD